MSSVRQDDEASQQEKVLRDIKARKVKSVSLTYGAYITVHINVNAYNPQRGAYIACLFKHLLTFPDSTLTLNFECVIEHESETLFTLTASDMQDSDKRMSVATHPQIFKNDILKAILMAMSYHSLPFDNAKFSRHLQSRVERGLNIQREHPAADINQPGKLCVEQVLILFSFNQDEKILAENIRIILPLIASGTALIELLDKLDATILKRIFKRLDRKQSILHLCFRHRVCNQLVNDVASRLLDLLDNQPANLVDVDENTLLHICRDTASLPALLPFVKDINSTNLAGDTALHRAAAQGDLEKYQFLLMHGADAGKLNRAGKKAIELVPRSSSTFFLFADCCQNGVTLQHPPVVQNQVGQTCGMYAIATATVYHWMTKASLFKTSPYPARKCDTKEESVFSLRELAKLNNATFAGEMFSTKGMAYLIKINNCAGFIIQPDSFENFLAEITASLAGDCPIIIPYSADLENQTVPTAFHAHWATIIGAYTDSRNSYILLANYGKYEIVDAAKLYWSFTSMEDTFPDCYLYKTDDMEWVKSKTEPRGKYSHLFKLPERDLKNDFKGKLIIVKPPGKW